MQAILRFQSNAQFHNEHSNMDNRVCEGQGMSISTE